MGKTMPTLAVAELVLIAGVVARITYEQTHYPSTPAEAQSVPSGDLYDCKDFTYQVEAQRIYDQDTSDHYGLDGQIRVAYEGQQGVASEELPYRPISGSGSPPPAPPVPGPPGGGNLLGSGGTKYAPVPLMPDRTCPKEFPSRRGESCRKARVWNIQK
jgi:hypothetical protein